jgi:chemotaxis protein MotB
MVRAMERLAKALASRPGRLIIRGHTDSRPFRSDVYDNWRLSTARAHMASYMLIRAGIEEARIWRVEGAADRMPRNAPDPKAPENRRIEILLQGIPG